MAQGSQEGGERVLVVGCGGVGGVCAVGLVEGGHQVTAVTHNEKITAAIREHGLTAHIGGEPHNVEIETHTELPDGAGPYDLALLAMPPNAMAGAVEALLPFLTDGAPLVSFQNGLPEERLAEQLGPERIVGGIVSYGASMLGPGEVEKTSEGGYTIGRLDGTEDASTAFVAKVLAASGEVEVTSNLRGARWSKLAINCAISSMGTIGGQRLGTLMRHRFVRRLCLETMTEVTQIALAEGVNLEKVSGTLDLEWFALDDDERLIAGSPSLFAKHTVLLAVGAKYRRLRSSMLAAIERGRVPPVDWLNGEITRRAPAHGIPVPINQALQDEVHAISNGDRPPSPETLRALFDRTRPTLRDLKLAA
jgi:2-dehydropantoate 2-reductase